MDTKKIKVLEFFGEPLNYGGQEAFITNLYSNINKDKIDFTFITPFKCTNMKLVELINKFGGTLIAENQNFNSKFRKKYIIMTAKKYINDKFDVVHINSGSIFTLFNVAKISKKNGVKKVITHSHAGGEVNLKYKVMKYYSDKNISKYADYFFACSELAGKWKYPENVLKSDKYFVIKNGINLKQYRYNEEKAREYRKKFKYNDEHILINVGRFSKEKNQLFLLDIFNETLKKDKKARLLMVGGEREKLGEIEAKIEELKLKSYVQILQDRNDVSELINMCDVFILPSLWEGLPVTGVEAQANGLPCIFSDAISDEMNISSVYYKLSLNDSAKVWSKKVISLFENKRKDTYNEIKKNGFDILDVCNFIEKIYTN